MSRICGHVPDRARTERLDRPVMGTTHLASGVAAGLAVGVLAPSPVLGLACGVVGGLTSYGPDLDHPSARATRELGPLGWLVCHCLRGVSSLLTGTKHRGITHSLLFAVVVAALVGVVAAQWLPLGVAALLALAGFAGVMAALAGDAVTRSGLDHVLWPLEWRLEIPKGLRLLTGGLMERFVVFPLMILGCVAAGGVVLGVWRL